MNMPAPVTVWIKRSFLPGWRRFPARRYFMRCERFMLDADGNKVRVQTEPEMVIELASGGFVVVGNIGQRIWREERHGPSVAISAGESGGSEVRVEQREPDGRGEAGEATSEARAS